MEFSRKDLIYLAGIETPKWKGTMGYSEREAQCKEYRKLIHIAKYLLTNPKDNATKEKLSELVQKLEIKIDKQ